MLGARIVWEKLTALEGAKVTLRPGEAFKEEVTKAGASRRRLTALQVEEKAATQHNISQHRSMKCKGAAAQIRPGGQGLVGTRFYRTLHSKVRSTFVFQKKQKHNRGQI